MKNTKSTFQKVNALALILVLVFSQMPAFAAADKSLIDPAMTAPTTSVGAPASEEKSSKEELWVTLEKAAERFESAGPLSPVDKTQVMDTETVPVIRPAGEPIVAALESVSVIRPEGDPQVMAPETISVTRPEGNPQVMAPESVRTGITITTTDSIVTEDIVPGEVMTLQDEIDHVAAILGKTPKFKKQLDGVCTDSIPAHCSETVAYFDADNNYLGKKVENYTEGGLVDIDGSEEFSSRTVTSVNWYDAEGVKIDFEQALLAVAAIQKTVFSDLVNTFGFSEDKLNQLIKDGLIKIQVDLKKLSATVSIDPSVTLSEGAVSLFDPLGSNKLPAEILYRLGQNPMPMIICAEGATCKSPTPTYHLQSASFRIGDAYSFDAFDISYMPENSLFGLWHFGDNRIRSVKVTHMDNPCGNNDACMAPATITLVKDISFKHGDDGSINAHIVYHNGSQGEIASRDVALVKMWDGQFHIQSVVDKDKDGKVLANSLFTYNKGRAWPVLVCVMAPCPQEDPVMLKHITRTDANGKVLSTISDIQSASGAGMEIREGAFIAVQKLPTGETVNLLFFSFEEMLAQALKNEASGMPPAVTAFVKQLQGLVGDGFKVAAVLQADGTYLVSVTDTKNHTMEPKSGLREMTLLISKDGEWLWKSLSLPTNPGIVAQPKNMAAFYNSTLPETLVEKDALRVLFEAMLTCPEGEVCKAVRISDMEALAKITQVHVTRVENSAVYFSQNGKNYKAYRDENGAVKVTELAVVSPKENLQVKAILGQAAAYKTKTVLANGAVEINYFDAAGNPIGTKTILTVTAENKTIVTWKKPAGDTVRIKTTISRNNDPSWGLITEKTTINYSAEGQALDKTVETLRYNKANTVILEKSTLFYPEAGNDKNYTAVSLIYNQDGSLFQKINNTFKNKILTFYSNYLAFVDSKGNSGLRPQVIQYLSPTTGWMLRQEHYEYPEDGIRSSIVRLEIYHTDGNGHLAKQTVKEYDLNGHLINKTITTYDSNGRLLRKRETIYFIGGGKPFMHNDSRYAYTSNGTQYKSAHYYSSYDTTGKLQHSISTTYFENGKTRSAADASYAYLPDGTRYAFSLKQDSYDMNGALLRSVTTLRDKNGKITYVDDYQYSNHKRFYRYYVNGVLVRTRIYPI